jgi:hypothetical protein
LTVIIKSETGASDSEILLTFVVSLKLTGSFKVGTGKGSDFECVEETVGVVPIEIEPAETPWSTGGLEFPELEITFEVHSRAICLCLLHLKQAPIFRRSGLAKRAEIPKLRPEPS